MTTKTSNQTTAMHREIASEYRLRVVQAAATVGLALLLLLIAPPAVQAHDDKPKDDPYATKCPGPYCFCGATVSGKVVFVADMQCMDEDGLTVGASGTKIDLNGFRLQCTTPIAFLPLGFHQSCQGATNLAAPGMLDTDPDPDIGINTNGKSNVEIKGSGSIIGFDIGVQVPGGKNIHVNRLNVSGPDALGGFFTELATDRPTTQGILVKNVVCPDSAVRIRRNSIDNHTDGILLNAAHCTEIEGNFIHDNNPGSAEFAPGESHAIHLANAANNKIYNNLVVDNGINVADDSGVLLDGSSTRGNRLVNNAISYNNGYGILARGGTGNRISNNSLSLNTSTEPAVPTGTDGANNRVFYDLADRNGGNIWESNNACETEETPFVPESVCNPGEATDPLK